MSKKNFDLSDYSSQNTQFIENEEAKETEPVEQSSKDIETNDIEQSTSEDTEKRVNMAFSDSNYEFIVSETSKLGVNFMYFLNYLIRTTSEEDINQLLDSQPFRKGGRSSAPRRRGHKLKRINFKLNTENHEKLNVLASKNDATITTIVNVILELYIAKNNVSTN